ncbi:N2227-domain-containing protein [Coprinopsis marcescibilis]|uniref:carnosine N-methyltransferase n=1 Tax=Coprinopsis marcescibilis TaxID=230819 RepID=A0A5C3L890_COPMA|nr:N2227-domain-containing protein [Coprinopsis marcescibilis]
MSSEAHTDHAEEERVHFQNVISTFNSYTQYTLAANNRRRRDIYSVPLEDQALLDALGYKKKLDDADEAILVNGDFLSQIVSQPDLFGNDNEDEEEDDTTLSEDNPANHPSHGEPSHSHRLAHAHEHAHSHGSHSHAAPGRKRKFRPTDFDMDKLRSTLKQFVRDWSEEGLSEREHCYKPMTDALVEYFSHAQMPDDRSKLRVLVPGAGLGRLAWDVANLGFSCQGNEFSHCMLLSSFFILNRTDQIGQHTLYPYVHSFSNAPNRNSILKKVYIPDVRPSDLPPTSNFSLVAGDFEEIYGTKSDPDEPQSGQWNAILTCFFLDTAKNIVNYLRIIHKILAPGGVWINLGPLLWHFENNNTNDPSIELDLEEVKMLAEQIGFDLSNTRTIDTTYTNNADSMLGYVYHAAFWTATKKG